MNDYYKTVLDALYYLLCSTGVKSWANWIAEDIRLWEQEKNIHHHLKANGGMSSLNDLVICVVNGNKIFPWQEPWANTLFEELKGLSFLLAVTISKEVYLDVDDIKKEFLGRGRPPIQGVRCLACGFSLLSKRDIDSYIAPQIVRDEILNGLENDQLTPTIIKCMSADFQAASEKRNEVEETIVRSKIHYTETYESMRPCKNCESDDTVVYRWIETTHKNPLTNDETIFIPAKDNLKLRTK